MYREQGLGFQLNEERDHYSRYAGDGVQEIPFVGPYAAFASYCQMLRALLHITSP